MVIRTLVRSLRFHLQIMKTFPPEVGQTSTLDTVQSVVRTSSGTFAAWHPDQDFPYEFSKPIDLSVSDTPTLVKESAINTAMEAFKKDNPELVREELRKLTYTTKHIWFARSRDKRAKKTPMDRPYL